MNAIETLAIRRLEVLKNEISNLHMDLFNLAQKEQLEPATKARHNNSLKDREAEFSVLIDALCNPWPQSERVYNSTPSAVSYKVDKNTGQWYPGPVPTVVAIYTDKSGTRIANYMDIKSFTRGFGDLLIQDQIKMVYWEDGAIKAIRSDDGATFFPQLER